MSEPSSFLQIRKSWISGNGTLYFAIPSEIVKKLKLNSDSYLLVDLIEDSIIVIKKHDPQFTKTELNKITLHETNTEENLVVIEEKSDEEEKEFDNPLRDLDL